MPPMALTRRRFLRDLLGTTGASLVGGGLVSGTALLPRPAHAIGAGSRFRVARLVVPGLEEDRRPGGTPRLVWEVLKRTSIDGDMETPVVSAGSVELFEQPFVTLFGDREFPAPSDHQVRSLRRFLSGGGFLFADSCGGREGAGFDRSFRLLMARVLPDLPLRRIDRSHTVYRSFYLLDRPHGRLRIKPHLEGATRDDRSMVIYSQNDLPGAWARDAFGGWLHPMGSGGEREREMCFRLGVNLVMYSLTLNYKRDQVHVKHLLKKYRARGGRPPALAPP